MLTRMLKMTLQFDGGAFTREANAYVKGVIEPALVDAANLIAADVVDALVEAMPRYLDRPNPFTLSAFKVKAAKIGGVAEAEVYAQPIQARYLIFPIEGGIRQAGDYATTAEGPLVPGAGATLDAYGNLPRDFVDNALQDPNVAWITLTPGRPPVLIRHAPGQPLEILAMIMESTTQPKKLPFEDIVVDAANAVAPDILATALGRR